MAAHSASRIRRGRRSPVVEGAAFIKSFKYLRNRISAFVALPLASIDRLAREAHVASPLPRLPFELLS